MIPDNTEYSPADEAGRLTVIRAALESFLSGSVAVTSDEECKAAEAALADLCRYAPRLSPGDPAAADSCYLLIEVRARPGHQVSSDTGFLRHHLHQLAAEAGLDTADNLIRPDRASNPWTGKPEPIEQARALMRAIMP
jgi:hypothetical protein